MAAFKLFFLDIQTVLTNLIPQINIQKDVIWSEVSEANLNKKLNKKPFLHWVDDKSPS